jgi:hypothetical protein
LAICLTAFQERKRVNGDQPDEDGAEREKAVGKTCRRIGKMATRVASVAILAISYACACVKIALDYLMKSSLF